MSQLENENIAGRLARVFIHHPLTAILAVFILALGYLSLSMTPREENPQIKVAGGAVIIPMPGAKANEIQKVIVEPLEQKIKEIKGVEHIYATAKDSVGIIQVQYYIGEDKESSDLKLYDLVMKNIDLLPKGAMQPIVKTMDIDTDIPIATIAFYAKDKRLSMTKLYKKVNKIGYEISRIENVATVDLKGEKKEQFNVLVKMDKLNHYNITMGQVAMAMKGLTFSLPDGKARLKNGEFVTFGIENAIKTKKDIENVIVDKYEGRAVLIKNIAKVTKGYDIQNKKSAYLYTKKDKDIAGEIPQTTLTISKLKGANTVNINETIFAYLEGMKEQLKKDGIGYVITRDDGYTANHAVNELVFHLEISIAIIAVLLIFALGFKEAVIVSLTVPMILALTLFAGFVLGETINRITLFALLLSLGLLVDAAIIVIENIHRHMHDPANSEKSLFRLAIDATNEIGNPTNVATIAIIMTFVPMFFVGGMMGQFMHPLPVFVPLALFFSLVVAYIFTPYLVDKFLKKREK